jgi:peptidoglycan hydrolase-like protein with peptidoglycan-binding domain
MKSKLDIMKAANPVLELQLTLNEIAIDNPDIPTIIPTGIFDQQTQNAISVFQRKFNLPVTGKVDYETWNNIRREHSMAMQNINTPGSVFCFPQNLKQCKMGDECYTIYVLQIILNYYHNKYKNYPNVQLTGIFDVQTETAVRQFQKLSNLPVTGIVDRQTWNLLNKINETCKLYND